MLNTSFKKNLDDLNDLNVCNGSAAAVIAATRDFYVVVSNVFLSFFYSHPYLEKG